MAGKYNFDQIIERRGTDSSKYGSLQRLYGRSDLIPLWVADMDFQSPPELIEGLIERCAHGIYGYPFVSQEYFDAIINWQKKYHKWEIKREEISFVPGVVKGIAFALTVFSEEGDKVIIQPPVYHPFRIVTQQHKREVVNNPLIFDGKQYRMDIKGLRELATEQDCKILILSNPHNPGGRVWSKEELEELAEICYENQILVISDEIHSDLVFGNHQHIPFATVSEKAAKNNITFNAPSKTFNVAGIVSSYSIINNKIIRDKFYNYLNINELDSGTIFSYLTLQKVYEQGKDWLKELKNYLWDNIKFVEKYLKENIPQIKAVIPEASFLVWLDCRELELSQKDLVSLFVNKAQLALNDGVMFGKEGTGFMRMNIGCPRSVLEKALDQLKQAMN